MADRDFIYAEVYFGSKSNGATTIPIGFTMGFIFNDGTGDITITGKTGTFTLKPDEKLHFESVGKPYNSIAIDATGSSVKYGYVKA